MAILRERSVTARQQLVELSEMGRKNDRWLENTRKTLQALLSAVDRGHATLIWSEHACGSFGGEMGALVWFDTSPEGGEAESIVRKAHRRGGSVFRRSLIEGHGRVVWARCIYRVRLRILYTKGRRSDRSADGWRGRCAALSTTGRAQCFSTISPKPLASFPPVSNSVLTKIRRCCARATRATNRISLSHLH